MLYNGKSDRSRGWKSKKLVDAGPSADGRPIRWQSIRRFDGAARIWSRWNNLSKDPELWYRNGNCYVHLYAKGESQSGPAFRLPFACLLDARCQPLIEKYVDRSVSEAEAFQNDRVDLYIPAPLRANQLQAFTYHVAVRNLFAWIFRRSVVGEQLGSTLIALANTLDKFRQPGVDNLQDLLAYLDEEGYLDVRDQPTHALAILHLAETFKMSDLYLESFAHCVGMSERLYKHSEYSRISPASRKLIRHARVDMDFRLSRAGAMLSDLLQEELSEAYLGLSPAARAHLERFRTYLHGFYATRFGSFPPLPSNKTCSTIFKPEVYRLMQADFAALYAYLVDTHFTADRSSSTAQGGLCALQIVHEFDFRHKFVPLPHPLPLLPEPVSAQSSRKRGSISWLVGGENIREPRGRPGPRLLSYAALMKATNHSQPHVTGNRLVIAYRQFEEDNLLMAHKAEPMERHGVGPVDARKVRWLLIYAIYQTLLSCAEPSSEVNANTELGYHLGISTSATPPWVAQGNSFNLSGFESRGTEKSFKVRPAEQTRTVSPIPLLSPISSPIKDERTHGGLDIQPDIDYFALTHPKTTAPATGRDKDEVSHDSGSSPPRTPPRTISLTKRMSIRKTLTAFRSPSAQRPGLSPSNTFGRAVSLSRKLIYHETSVPGYVDDTRDVLDAPENASPLEERPARSTSPKMSVKTNVSTTRSRSTSSNSSYRSAQSQSSAVPSDVSTTPTSPVSSTWKLPVRSETNDSIADASTLYERSLGGKSSCTDLKHLNPTVPTRSSSLRKTVRSMYANDDMLMASSLAEAPPVPRRSSKRLSRDQQNIKRWSMVDISAALRGDDLEEDSDSSSDYGTDTESEDMRAGLRPRPLTIQKVPTRVEDEKGEDSAMPVSPITKGSNSAMDGALEQEIPMAVSPITTKSANGEEGVPQTPDDWERMVRSGIFAAPPCAWEQFTDLGGLQECLG